MERRIVSDIANFEALLKCHATLSCMHIDANGNRTHVHASRVRLLHDPAGYLIAKIRFGDHISITMEGLLSYDDNGTPTLTLVTERYNSHQGGYIQMTYDEDGYPHIVDQIIIVDKEDRHNPNGGHPYHNVASIRE
jgi:hypothetical protein